MHSPTALSMRSTLAAFGSGLTLALAAALWLAPALQAQIVDVLPAEPPKHPILQHIQDLTQPRPAPAPGSPSAPKPMVGQQLIKYGNPVVFGREVQQGYSNRAFLSTHGTVHPNPGDAMLHSLAPAQGRANTRAAVRGGLDPANVALTFGIPIAQEAVRQMIQDGRIDPAEMGQNLRPAALVGSFAGGVAGTVAGAAVQSALASAFGPVGTVAGFVARPLIAWGGGLLGANLGENAAHGNLSLGDAFRQSIAAIQPGRDLGSVVGGTVGMVVGQALIPIPGVGGFVGSMVGTMVGGWVGAQLFDKQPTGDQSDKLIRQGVRGLFQKIPTPGLQTGPGSYQPMQGLATGGN
jgi:hypothetical protein